MARNCVTSASTNDVISFVRYVYIVTAARRRAVLVAGSNRYSTYREEERRARSIRGYIRDILMCHRARSRARARPRALNSEREHAVRETRR